MHERARVVLVWAWWREGERDTGRWWPWAQLQDWTGEKGRQDWMGVGISVESRSIRVGENPLAGRNGQNLPVLQIMRSRATYSLIFSCNRLGKALLFLRQVILKIWYQTVFRTSREWLATLEINLTVWKSSNYRCGVREWRLIDIDLNKAMHAIAPKWGAKERLEYRYIEVGIFMRARLMNPIRV